MTEPVQLPPGLARMRELASARRQRTAEEQCELCSADVAPDHGHVVNLMQRTLMCVCRPCYLLFAHEAASGGRFRAVPDRYLELGQIDVDASPWNALEIPVGLAFLFYNSAEQRTVAFYPGPAGATESELSLDAWTSIAEAVPALGTLTPDVEALLLRRHVSGPGRGPSDGPDRTDAFVVPIDACYELVGRLRREWRGFQGGDQAWQAVDDVFARIVERAGGAMSA